MSLEYASTAGALQCLPAAGAGATVTPSGVAWTNSAYAQIIASTAEAYLLLGVTVRPPQGSQGFDADDTFEIDVATGGAGSETVIATASGSATQVTSALIDTDGFIPFAIPIDNIGSGVRVSVRLRKVRTEVTTWTVAVEVCKQSTAGPLTKTTNPILSYPASGAVTTTTPGAGGFTNTAYVQVIASTADAVYLAGVVGRQGSLTGASQNMEVDIAIGGAGSEVVITTVRFGAMGDCPAYFLLRPLLDAIPSGSRIALRTRTNNNNGNNHLKLAYYNKTSIGTVTNLLNTAPMKWMPAAAAPTNVPQSGTNWNNGAYVQFSASLANAIQIAALAVGGTNGPEHEVDLAIGGAGSEVVKGTTRLQYTSFTPGGMGPVFAPCIDRFPAASRLALRSRGNGNNSGGTDIAIGYYESVTSGLVTTQALATLPPSADGISVTPSGSAWASSAWVQLVASLAATGMLLTVNWRVGVGDVEFELDLATGGAGAETTVATVRGYTRNTNTGNKFLPLILPFPVTAGQRIAARLRKAGTDTTAWTIAATLSGDTASAGFSGSPLMVILAGAGSM